MANNVQKRKTLLILEGVGILIVMSGIMIVTALQLFGWIGVTVIALGAGFLVYWVGKQTQNAEPSNAFPLNKDTAPGIYAILKDLCNQANIRDIPEIYISPAGVMNAATIDKPDNPIIILTRPIINQMNEREIEGILAHEISHIRHKDTAYFKLTLIMRLVTSIIARVAWIMLILYFPFFFMTNERFPTYIIILLFSAPIISILLQLAFSRSREFNADLGAIELTEDPKGLASALRKIENVQTSLLRQLFPMPQKEESSVFRSHPAIPKRIERLEEIAQGQD